MNTTSPPFLIVLSAIKEIAVTSAAVGGVIIAWRGLATWRKQLKGQAEYELSRRILRSTYRVRDAIGAVRHPFMSAGELGAAAGDVPIERRDESGGKPPDPTPIAYNKRWSFVQSAVSDLAVEILETEALWGGSATTTFDPLYHCVTELRVSLEMYLREKYGPDRERSTDGEFSKKLFEVVFSVSHGDQPDQFDAALKAAVSRIDEYFRPKLKV